MSRQSPCLKHGCSACCHETEMPLTAEDIARIEKLGHDKNDFSQLDDDGLRRLTNDPTRAGPQGAPCHFLHDNQCSIYNDRPEGCRIYPFVLDIGNRVTRDEDCPHAGEFPRAPDTKRRLMRVVSRLRVERE